MAAVSLQSIVAHGPVEVACGANLGTYAILQHWHTTLQMIHAQSHVTRRYTGGLNAESRPHGFGGTYVFRNMTDHCEFVGAFIGRWSPRKMRHWHDRSLMNTTLNRINKP